MQMLFQRGILRQSLMHAGLNKNFVNERILKAESCVREGGGLLTFYCLKVRREHIDTLKLFRQEGILF